MTTTETNTDWLLETIKGKSDQLNACDLVSGPEVLYVRKVIPAKDEKGKPSFWFDIGDGKQPYKPCLSMRRVILGAWDRKQSWIGRALQVYCDPTIKFGGEKVGGIRISHMSHIEKTLEIPLTVSKGKSSVYIVHPLQIAAPPAESTEARIAKVLAAIENAKNADDLATVMRKAKQLYETLTIEQQAQIDNAKLAKGF